MLYLKLVFNYFLLVKPFPSDYNILSNIDLNDVKLC